MTRRVKGLAPAHAPLSDDMLAVVAAQFRALGEPSRLKLLQLLCEGEATVNALAERSGLSQANTSKHLALLDQHGFVVRRRDGNQVVCALADASTQELCAVMCRRVASRIEREQQRLRALR